MSISWRLRHIAVGGGISFIQHLPSEKQAMEIVWSAARLQAESLSWWFGLRKCIRPVCGDKLLAIMESAHR
jgi:hypothetical protein